MITIPPQCPQPKPIKWRLVIQQRRKTYLHAICLSDTDTGPQVMQKIKSTFKNAVPYHHWSQVLAFQYLALETASLTAVSILTQHLRCIRTKTQVYQFSDLEPQLPHEVFVVDCQPNRAFTNGLPQTNCFRRHGPFYSLESSVRCCE